MVEIKGEADYVETLTADSSGRVNIGKKYANARVEVTARVIDDGTTEEGGDD